MTERSALAALLVSLALAVPGGAATVLEKRVAVDIQPGGGVSERVALKVLLETPGDLEAWGAYPVYLDENRSLRSFDAWVVREGGERRKIGRRRQDRMEYSGHLTAGSSFFQVIEFPGLEPGTVLEIAHVVDAEPYFPASQVGLLGSDAIAELEVTVRSGAPGDALRWRLDGPRAGLEVAELPGGGVAVRGRDLEGLDPPQLAAGGAASAPVLRWAWGADPSWQGVGRWYRDLLAAVPREAGELGRLAAELAAGAEAPRQRLEAILADLRRKVRYVAVEIGAGGYRPSQPAEVLERGWGDCKDKSLLLVDLLARAGIEAHPALVLNAAGRRIDREFPSPAQFNHVIVAVPEKAVLIRDGDPTAGGYLFLDPTQTYGGARWLHPGVQDQAALVITAEGGELVRTPLMPEHERATLAVELEVTPAGGASGRAGLKLEGSQATGFIEQMANAPSERTAEDVRRIFGRLLPGARLSDVGWRREEGEVPAVRMSLAVEIDGLVAGAERPAFQLSSLRSTPEPRLLDDLDTAAVYPARTARTFWSLALPDGWCPPKAAEMTVANAVGSFVQTVALDAAGRVVVERRSELRRRWIEPGELADLEELALAEHRAARRRIRLACEE